MARRTYPQLPAHIYSALSWLPDRDLVEPEGVESVPELRHLLHASSDVDISELMLDLHIEQGY